MAIQITEINDQIFGKCVRMENNVIDLLVSVSFGPRILSFGFSKEENIFWNDPNRLHKNTAPEIAEAYGEGSCFYEYGGHRIGLAPARMPDSYYPDNDPVTYALRPDGVLFTPPPQRHNDIQTNLELVLSPESPDLMVVHSVINIGKEKRHLALWPVTMLQPGGTAILPQNLAEEAPELPNRVLTLWPGSSIRDSRLILGDRYLSVQHSPRPDHKRLIVGTNNLDGWMAYVYKQTTFVKRYVHNPRISYPNHNSSCRIYTDNDFIQLESISPMYGLDPGQAIRHVENFSLYHTPVLPQNPQDFEISQFIDHLK